MKMPIPGLKVLDEIIAGLPTNSAQRLELSKLRGEATQDKARIKELEAQLAALQPHAGLDVEAGKILKMFFDHSGIFTAHQIAELRGAQKSVIDFHFDALRSAGFIKRWGAVDGFPGYRITAEGRSFIVKHGFA